jgi:hypothetical protein
MANTFIEDGDPKPDHLSDPDWVLWHTFETKFRNEKRRIFQDEDDLSGRRAGLRKDIEALSEEWKEWKRADDAKEAARKAKRRKDKEARAAAEAALVETGPAPAKAPPAASMDVKQHPAADASANEPSPQRGTHKRQTSSVVEVVHVQTPILGSPPKVASPSRQPPDSDTLTTGQDMEMSEDEPNGGGVSNNCIKSSSSPGPQPEPEFEAEQVKLMELDPVEPSDPVAPTSASPALNGDAGAFLQPISTQIADRDDLHQGLADRVVASKLAARKAAKGKRSAPNLELGVVHKAPAVNPPSSLLQKGMQVLARLVDRDDESTSRPSNAPAVLSGMATVQSYGFHGDESSDNDEDVDVSDYTVHSSSKKRPASPHSTSFRRPASQDDGGAKRAKLERLPSAEVRNESPKHVRWP